MATELTKVSVSITVESGDNWPSKTLSKVERTDSAPHNLTDGDPAVLRDLIAATTDDAVIRAQREVFAQAELARIQAENEPPDPD
jgi:hypothetical protein